MKYGKTLKVFVMGTDSRSLKLIELSNWNGLAFVGGRQHIEQARSRSELNEPAIYMLLNEGSVAGGGATDIYIGEAEDFISRLQQHVRDPSKDWFTQFIVFVVRDNNLTKAHVKYLELELYNLAKNSIGTLVVKNGNTPPGASLPECEISTMKEFQDNIIFVLESLGLSYFQNITNRNSINLIKNYPFQGSESNTQTINGMEFYISLPRELGINESEVLKSYMIVSNGSYILKAGSVIRRIPTESFSECSYFGLWKQIVESDAVTITANEKLLKTTRDIEFTAPSGVGAIVRGRATNGRTEWKRITDDKALNDCEAEYLVISQI